jgi:phospholipid-binding lipoprotein MlaA
LGRSTSGAAFVCLLVLLAGCASVWSPADHGDPLKPANERVLGFNRKFDDYAFRPVARGWSVVTTQGMRTAIARFFHNSAAPSRVVSSLGQGAGGKAAVESARFLVNTTVGVAGLFDPASAIGLPSYNEDMAQMFGRWGIPPGPYLVLPLFGPSTPRELTGRALDVVLNPLTWFAPVGSGVLFAINARAQADSEIESAKRSALDYYVFVRSAYLQNRESLIFDADQPDHIHGRKPDPYADLYRDFEDDAIAP